MSSNSTRVRTQVLRVFAGSLISMAACGLFVSCRSTPQPPETAEPQRLRSAVEIEAEIPVITRPVRVIELTNRTPPNEFVLRTLRATSPDANLEPLANHPLFAGQNEAELQSLDGYVEENRVKAWVDRRSGDAQIHPTLGILTPISGGAANSMDQARAAFEALQLDDPITDYKILGPRTLAGSDARLLADGSSETTPVQEFLYYYAAQRYVDELPVYGPGSRASVAIGGGGNVHATTRIWRRATLSRRQVVVQRVDTNLLERIRGQLDPLTRNARVQLKQIQIVYYDEGGTTLEPAYRFTARLSPRQGTDRARPEYVTGYEQFGDAGVRLPPLSPTTPPVRPPPVRPPPPLDPSRPLPMSSQSGPTRLRVGHYVARDVVPTFASSAEQFWNVLSTAPGRFSRQAFRLDTTPKMFKAERPIYVGAADLVLVEAHGDSRMIHTLDRSDSVDFGTLSPMAPPATSGDWVLHSCDVLPDADDSAWAQNWRSVMHDVRAVVGFRTSIVITDGATAAYAARLKLFNPIVGAWFNEINTLSEYMKPRSVDDEPIGHAAAIVLCGHQDDSLSLRVPSAQPTCLINRYMVD